MWTMRIVSSFSSVSIAAKGFARLEKGGGRRLGFWLGGGPVPRHRGLDRGWLVRLALRKVGFLGFCHLWGSGGGWLGCVRLPWVERGKCHL